MVEKRREPTCFTVNCCVVSVVASFQVTHEGINWVLVEEEKKRLKYNLRISVKLALRVKLVN